VLAARGDQHGLFVHGIEGVCGTDQLTCERGTAAVDHFFPEVRISAKSRSSYGAFCGVISVAMALLED
jgi:hypothetical protein